MDSENTVLKPYVFHGLDMTIKTGSVQALTDCPFCGRSGKFVVHTQTGLWRCLVCNEGSENDKMAKGGNTTTFLRKLWEHSHKQSVIEHDKGSRDYHELAAHRKLLRPETLIAWGVCKSIITGHWLVPGHSPDGKLNQLYVYREGGPSNKRLLYATTGIKHQLHGANGLFDKKKSTVYLCEGPWDAMALWEAMKHAKYDDEYNLSPTANEEASLLADCNILAAPGCQVFYDTWATLFNNRQVYLMYDSDKPRANPKTGVLNPPVGYEGMKRVAKMLAKAEEHPKEIHCIQWGDEGYDPTLPNGFDVRDALSKGKNLTDRLSLLEDLLNKTGPIPEEWVAGRTQAAVTTGGMDVECTPCSEWSTLITQWRKAMKWTEGLDRALSIMLASVASVDAVGDQLWLKIIGPASCGKSTLCEALSVSKKWVKATSTMTGFHSGYRESGDTREDNSLVSKLFGKTLITKDGDTLLQAANLDVILSQARDIYDRVSRVHYGNKVQRDYEGISMTWLLCGTSSLRQLDSSELGERFLDCVIMEGIDSDLEAEINLRVAHRVIRNLKAGSVKAGQGQDDEDMLKAKQLTGGYVDYLRSNASDLLANVEVSDQAAARCIQFATFLAYMRARPSTRQNETAEREFSSRLVSQHLRLAICLSVVLNRKEVDDEVMRRVRQTCLDTARGKTLEIAKYLYEEGEHGLDTDSLAVLGHVDRGELRTLLQFLRRIKAIEVFTVKSAGVKSRPRWRLSPIMLSLYEQVVMQK